MKGFDERLRIRWWGSRSCGAGSEDRRSVGFGCAPHAPGAGARAAAVAGARGAGAARATRRAWLSGARRRRRWSAQSRKLLGARAPRLRGGRPRRPFLPAERAAVTGDDARHGLARAHRHRHSAYRSRFSRQLCMAAHRAGTLVHGGKVAPALPCGGRRWVAWARGWSGGPF